MRLYWPYLMALIIIATNAIAWAQDFNVFAAEEEREKRAIDFGQFVRNLLLNSAAASNIKSDITRNVANLKTTTRAPRRRTTTTTTTTTTVAPFFFNKGPFKFPFDLSAPFNNKINLNSNKLSNSNNNRGYINFDYNDYGGTRQTVRPGRRRRPTTTTTTTRGTTTRAPLPTPTPRQRQPPPQPPTRRGPIPRRPYGLFGKQKVPHFQYYNDDDADDYNYEDDDDDYDTDQTNTTTSAPATRRPPPPPPSARPQRPPTAARARAQGRVPQLRNRLVYQFRQPDDTSTNNKDDNNAQPPAAAAAATAAPTEDSTTSTNNNDGEESQTENSENDDAGNNEETSVNTNDDYTDDSAGDNGDDVNNNSNTANSAQQDDNVDTNNASDDTNNNNFNFNLPSFPPFPTRNQFNYAGGNYVPNIANFGPSASFQYPSYNDYGTQYHPSAPADYSLPYY